MHPPLVLSQNQRCVDQILALKLCHERAGLVGRLTAQCNAQKNHLDKCLRAAKKVKVRASLEAARDERKRFKALISGEDDGDKSR